MNVIDRARERIERDGWYQKDRSSVFVDGRSTVCILTAMHHVEADAAIKGHGYDAIATELGRPGSGPTACLNFNDDPSTSLEDVLLVMKRASARFDEAAS